MQQPRHRQSHGPRSRIRDLGVTECWGLLAAHRVGRIGFNAVGYPQIYPMTFTLVDQSIYFRTTPDGPIDADVADTAVAFQADWINETLHTGWSVLILGWSQRVNDPSMITSLEGTHFVDPCTEDPRGIFIRIIADQITGRHIRQA